MVTRAVSIAAQLLAAGSLCALAGTPRPAPRSLAPVSSHSGESCYAARDLVVQALERLSPDSSSSQLMDANESLKRAIDLCGELGDAWYYRSLIERQLRHAAPPPFFAKQAELFGSEALQQKLDPFVLATPKSAAPQPLAPIRQRWALIVGIGSFADHTVKPLAFTTGDAQAFHDILVDPRVGGFSASNVRLLTDDHATLREIKESLNWLARSAGPDDLVVVYFASHGSARTVDTAGANYILTHDTEIGPEINPDKLYATALPMIDLANDIATRIQSRRTAVFLDTCYSGGAFTPNNRQLAPGVATASVSKATLDHITQGTGRIIFAASRTDQESLESADLHHGYFTYFLVQALKANPGQPLSKIFASVEQHVSTQVETDQAMYGLHQNPVMNRSSDETDFALGTTPAVVAANVSQGNR